AKQGAIDAWETLKDKTSEAFNKVVDFIKDPLGDIDLFSMGKDIIQGLIDGIGSMASAVWDKAKGIANGIGDSIKGALGIASPSKLMKEFGVFTGQGLEVGMQSMIRDINRASEDMAMAALPEVDTVDLTYESRNLKNNHIQPRTVNGSSGVTQNITINSPDDTS